MIMLSARDWRDAVENGDVDAIIIPTASTYYGGNLLADRSVESLEKLLPPSAIWVAENYTNARDRESACHIILDNFSRYTPSVNCSNIFSERLENPGYNQIPLANERVKQLPPVMAISVCGSVELPADKMKHAASTAHYSGISTTWLYEQSANHIGGILREAIARAAKTVHERWKTPTSVDTINIGIAPLFGERGYKPISGSRKEGYHFNDPYRYSNRMLDVLARYTYPTYVTIFYNPVED